MMSIGSPQSRGYVVRFVDLPRWDIKTGRAAQFRSAHPHFRPLGTWLEDATEMVKPREQPDKEWPVYGVNNECGVFFSHSQRGATFHSAYKRIRKDWFFHNPTRANVGSLGRVPDVPPDAITSPEYQVWRVREGLRLEFVEILIRLPFFLALIACHRVGAVKQRLFTENLLQIPVPPLSEAAQVAIVRRWRQGADAVSAAGARAAAVRSETATRFLDDLGLRFSPDAAPLRSFRRRWAGLDRWSTSANQAALASVDLDAGKYPTVALGEIEKLVQYGTSEKANTERRGVAVLRINNIKHGVLDLTDLKHVALSAQSAAVLRLEAGDILVIRTSGSRNLVGTCAVFDGPGDFVFASYLIRIRVDRACAEPSFVTAYVNSPAGRRQVDALSRKIMMNNINSVELRSLRLPLPSLPVQLEIMHRVEAGRREIAKLREEAQAAAKRTEVEVEEMILGRREAGGEAGG